MGLINGIYQLYQHFHDPDKAKREQLQNLLAAKPELLQSLADQFGNDPQSFLKGLGINSQNQGLANLIGNTPLSEPAKIKSLQKLGELSPEDFSNATKRVDLRAIPQSQILNYAPKIGQGPDALLTPEQQDIRAKLSGMPIKAERDAIQVQIDKDKQQLANSKLEGQKLEKELPGVGALSQSRVLENQETQARLGRVSAARKYVVENKLTPYKAYYNPETPADVKAGIFEDEGLKGQFTSEMDKAYKQSALDLQREAFSSKHDENIILGQKRVEHALNVANKFGADPKDVLGAMNFKGDIDGLINTDDNKLSPEIQRIKKGAIALKASAELLPAQQVKATYNDFLARNRDLFNQIRLGKIKDYGEVKAAVGQINNEAITYFGQLGIKAPQWEYGQEGNPESRGLGTGHYLFHKSPVLYIKDPGDEKLGLAKDDLSSELDAEAQQVANLILSGKAVSTTTLADKRMKPDVRKRVLELLARPRGK